jgi:hypothetical protein
VLVDVSGQAVNEKNRKSPLYPIGQVPLASSVVLTYVFNRFCQSHQKKEKQSAENCNFEYLSIVVELFKCVISLFQSILIYIHVCKV